MPPHAPGPVPTRHVSQSDAPDREGDPRVYLAGERTMLAWIRTGLALMGFGFVVARFGLFLRELAPTGPDGTPVPRGGVSLWVGTALVVLGVLVNIVAAVQHAAFVRRFRANRPLLTHRRPVEIALAALLALLGAGMAAYLLWFR